MADSSQKLLEWVNDTVHHNYTKVEQLGSGVAYCQILDKIFGDVQLANLKFHDNRVCAYLDNFKLLQKTFERHKIDKAIPVKRLVKGRYQDNLKFLRWIKSLWDEHYQNANGQTASVAGPSSVNTNKLADLQQKVLQLQATIDAIQEDKQASLLKLEAIERVVIKSQSLVHNKPGSLANTFKKISQILNSEKEDME